MIIDNSTQPDKTNSRQNAALCMARLELYLNLERVLNMQMA